jgi:hypothetical protein
VAVIRFECACGGPLQAEAAQAGRQGKCPYCGRLFQIPGPAASQSVQATPSPPPRATCSICQSALLPGEARTACPGCGLPFHAECWKQNYGCSAYGCSQVNILRPGPDVRVTPTAPAAARPARRAPVGVEGPAARDYVVLLFGVAAVLVGLLTFGVPCGPVAIAAGGYLKQAEGRPVGVLVFGLALALVGLITGAITSFYYWVG